MNCNVLNIPDEVLENLALGTGRPVREFGLQLRSLADSPDELLSLVSNVLCSSATTKLPKHWSWAATQPGHTKSITLDELIAKWNRANDGICLEVARLLADVFCPRFNSQGVRANELPNLDLYSTRLERILPEQYGQWIVEKGSDNTPNCLGKFQLLVAFGKRIEAPMMAIVPLIAHYQISNYYRAQFARQTLDFMEAHRIGLSEERHSSLQSVIAFVEQAQRYDHLQHYAVAYRLASGKWILVDPNMGMASFALEGWELDRRYAELSADRKAHPLEMVIEMSPEYGIECRQIARKFEVTQLRLAEELSGMRHTETEEQIEEHAYVRLTSFQRELGQMKRLKQWTASLRHPAIEIGLAEPRLAAATLSHIGYECSLDAGDQIDRQLVRLGGPQGHLYNVASTLYRASRIEREEAKGAMRALAKLPIVSIANQGLMAKLIRDGF